MTIRIAPTHAVFLALSLAFTVAMNWSAISARFSLNNLIVLSPASVVLVVLVVVLALTARDTASDEPLAKTLGDLALLGLFCAFCGLLFMVGFDLATFFFVWLGIVICGERSLWKPPAFALVFTLIVVEAFGALFPFDMPTMVL